MSKYQVNAIADIMKFTIEEAEQLLEVMDATNDHPDWSESSNNQLRKHFKSVLSGS